MQETTTPATPELQFNWQPAATPEQLLHRAWQTHTLSPTPLADFVGDFFRIDESVPAVLLEQAPELGLTATEIRAAIEYWRATLVKAVNAAAARYTASNPF